MVEVEGRVIKPSDRLVYIILNKPKGYVPAMKRAAYGYGPIRDIEKEYFP